MVNLGEQFAQNYWERQGLKAERFSAAEIGQGKTPDFRVLKSVASSSRIAKPSMGTARRLA